MARASGKRVLTTTATAAGHGPRAATSRLADGARLETAVQRALQLASRALGLATADHADCGTQGCLIGWSSVLSTHWCPVVFGLVPLYDQERAMLTETAFDQPSSA